MSYINFKGAHGVETVEDLRGLPKAERRRLLAEYKQVSAAYYISERATKAHYKSEKDQNNDNVK